MIQSQNISNAFYSSIDDGSLKKILKRFGFEIGGASMNQTHSSNVKFAYSSSIYECDGIYTNKKLLPLVVKTADCVPILMKSNKAVSATHAGWQVYKN